MLFELRHRRRARALWLAATILVAAALLSGCGIPGSQATPPSDAADGDGTLTETSGPGRVFTTADGELTIQIPENAALEAPIEAEVLAARDLPTELVERKASGKVYRLSPTGSTFAVPLVVTRRIPIDEFGWKRADGVPAAALAMRAEDGSWSFLRDQRVRLDGETVVTSAETTTLGTLVVVALPAQVQLTDAAQAVTVAPGQTVPAPAADAVRVFGPVSMFEAVRDEWIAAAAEDRLVMSGQGAGVLVDAQLLTVLLDEYDEALQTGRVAARDEHATIPGDALVLDLAPSFDARVFRRGFALGDPAAWDAPQRPAGEPVTCRTPDDATSAVAIAGEGILRPLLASLGSDLLPGLEGSVPAFSFIVPFDVRCRGVAPVPATADPKLEAACLTVRPAARSGRGRVRIWMRLSGIEKVQGTRVEIVVRTGGRSAVHEARYHPGSGLWATRERPVRGGGDTEIASATVRTVDGATTDIGEELLTRLADARLDQVPSRTGDLCTDVPR